jgi:hypothetical protein
MAEDQLKAAIILGDNAQVVRIMAGNPDVNWRGATGRALFLCACVYKRTEAVRLLLGRPDLNVNVTEADEETGFLHACKRGYVQIGRMLLDDPRTDLNRRDIYGYSPFACAVRSSPELVLWWVASGRWADLGGGEGVNADAVLVAQRSTLGATKRLHGLMVLLRDGRPEEAKRLARWQLGLDDTAAARFFSPVVFLSDGLLGITRTGGPASRAQRFFAIMVRLPMELQMIIANRVAGSGRDNISGHSREMGLRELAGASPLASRGFASHH